MADKARTTTARRVSALLATLALSAALSCHDDTTVGTGDTAADTFADTAVADADAAVDTSDDATADISTPDTTPTDTTPTDTTPAPGEPYSPCVANSDCNSGFCAPSADGLVCIPYCQENCPDGWSCQLLQQPGADPVFVCLDVTVNLCRPCNTHEDCQENSGNPGARCIPSTTQDGSFCGIDCSTAPCPLSYSCEDVDDPNGGPPSSQCVPDNGTCECNAWAQLDGAATTCGTGGCARPRACTADGLEDCPAPEPTDELCNDADDDCDGDVDEDFINGGFYVHPEHCGACGTSCRDVFDNGVGTCGLVNGLPTCVVETCDDGFEQVLPTQCAPTAADQCEPCNSQADCPEWLTCAPVGAGAFCVEACALGSVGECANGYICTAAAGGGGQCTLATGGCGFTGKPCESPSHCEDLNPCTVDTCDGGVCSFAGTACDDGNPCTLDSCDPATGCSSVAVADGLACDADESGCTVGDACSAGACIPGPAATCDDALSCTGDECVSTGPTSFDCAHPVATGCLVAGSCVALGTVNPDNACQVCDAAQPQAWSPVSDGTSCNADDDLCTQADSCLAGICTAGDAPDCNDGLECTADSCASGATDFSCDHAQQPGFCVIAGACIVDGSVHPENPCEQCNAAVDPTDWSPIADGTSCDADANGCTQADACLAGACVAGAPPSCDDGLPCTDDACVSTGALTFECAHPVSTAICLIDGACVADGATNPDNPCLACSVADATGAWTEVEAGTSCDADGSGCTVDDACQGGVCVAGAPPDCSDALLCTTDTCAPDGPTAYTCEHAVEAGSCLVSGQCYTAGDLSPGDDCQVCAPGVSASAFSPSPDGSSCNADSGGCTQDDACMAGSCVAGTTAGCDDGLSCTADSCESTGPASFTCVHATEPESCIIGGTCWGVGDANPANPCQVCDPGLDAAAWSAAPAGTSCDADASGCTENDTCQAGTCVPGPMPSCSDGLSCTADMCVSTGATTFECAHTTVPGTCLVDNLCYDQGGLNPANACEVCDALTTSSGFTPRADATACDADADGCSVGDMCQAGVCVAGPAPDCSDAFPCTEDVCVSNGPTSFTCDHPVAAGGCLISDTCYGDGDPNPANSCQLCDADAASQSWSAQANQTPCDADGTGCTVDDVCLAGTCQAGSPPLCPKLPCTQDVCEPNGPDGYTCTQVALPGFCVIDNQCYGHGDVDPANACAQCDSTAAPEAWSPRADGVSCDADASGCTVGDACAAGVCQPGADADCGDAFSCTEDICVPDGPTSFSCTHLTLPTACLIDGACRADGDTNPANSCLRCDPAINNGGWTDEPNGKACDADGDGCTVSDTCAAGLCQAGPTPPCNDAFACTDNVCVSDGPDGFSCTNPVSTGFCFIDGQCYGDGASQGANACQICSSTVSQSDWSAALNATPCDADGDGCTVADTCAAGVCEPGAAPVCNDALSCTEDTCASTGVDSYVCTHPVDGASCLIEGACWPGGAPNPANPCQVCDPAVSSLAWSDAAAGTSCDADSNGCTVGDTCAGGVCQPGPAPDCSDGIECTAGACVSTSATSFDCDTTVISSACRIADVCYQEGEANPDNPCQVCDPATSTTAWSDQADGLACDADGDGCTEGDSCMAGACTAGPAASCDDGLSCTVDSCSSTGANSFSCSHDVTPDSCLIGAVCYANGGTNPGNACEICDAATSDTAWTSKADATPCDADGSGCTVDDACVSGACVAGPAPDCGDGLSCTTDGCQSTGTDSFMCTNVIDIDACVIDGSCVDSGTPQPGNSCQACTPAIGQAAWSPVANGTSCSDGAACTVGDVCLDGTCSGTLNTACSPGQVESEACGDCGTRSRSCTSVCTWGSWSSCGGEGVCSTGTTATQEVACGNCGSQTQTRTCGASCSWPGWSNVGGCDGQGVCAPSSTQNQTVGCGNCGSKTQRRTCSGSCGWGAWGDTSTCTGQGVCAVGATQTRTVACGNCGTQQQRRTCSSSCGWGGWVNITSCSGQGTCAPGAIQNRTVACGNCGTRTQRRTCSSTCGWGGWANTSSCSGQGVCSPGSTTQSTCEGCSQKVCTNSCQWGGCTLKPGNACNWNSGTNFRCCQCSPNTGKSQFCLSSCQWSTACNTACTGCIGYCQNWCN